MAADRDLARPQPGRHDTGHDTGPGVGDPVIGAGAGAVGGLIGGIAFGLIMQSAQMIPLVAALVGGSSGLTGWGVHLGIAVLLGGVLGMMASPLNRPLAVLAVALVYGTAWWVLGALVIMPVLLRMPVLVLGPGAWTSLWGHLLYALLTALVILRLDRRAGPWWPVRSRGRRGRRHR